MDHRQAKRCRELRCNDRAATKRLWQIIASSAARISSSPNCQASQGFGRLPRRCAVVSSIPIGRLRPKNVEGIMRSVQALAVAVLLLLPAFDVASAGEPQQGGIPPGYYPASPGSAPRPEGAAHPNNNSLMPGFN